MILLSAAVLVAGGQASPSFAKAENGKVFGKWEVSCSVPPGQSESRCAVTQTLMVTETKARLITLEIGSDGKTGMVAVALLPLGIDIPSGVSMVLEKGTHPAMVIHNCSANGCLATLSLTASQVDELKADKDLKVRAQLPGLPSPADIPVSLEGFGAALDSLK